jgi:hypothetical protein
MQIGLLHADFLLKNTSTKHSKYFVNQKLADVDDISFRELFGRIRVVFFIFLLQHKICSFLAQAICIYVVHSFLMNHSWTNSLNMTFS